MTAALRLLIGATLGVSAFIHAWLHVHGYAHIPVVGAGFLVQASVFLAVGILVALGGPSWLVLSAAPLAAGALVAFALSRTVGIAGFVERGWQPAPHAAVSVASEVVTVIVTILYWLKIRRSPSRR